MKENQYSPQIVFHPGETLREKMDEMRIGTKEFSMRAGKPEKTVIAILKGDSSITADMAVRFEYVTGIPARFWMKSQKAYEEYIAHILINVGADLCVCPLRDVVRRYCTKYGFNIGRYTFITGKRLNKH